MNEVAFLTRSARSLAYNRDLAPIIDGRIARAEANLRGYMLANDIQTLRVGYFQAELDPAGIVQIERLPADDWTQLSLLEEQRARSLDSSGPL